MENEITTIFECSVCNQRISVLSTKDEMDIGKNFIHYGERFTDKPFVRMFVVCTNCYKYGSGKTGLNLTCQKCKKLIGRADVNLSKRDGHEIRPDINVTCGSCISKMIDKKLASEEKKKKK